MWADSPVYLAGGWNSGGRRTSTEAQAAHIHTLFLQYTTQNPASGCQTCPHEHSKISCEASAILTSLTLLPGFMINSMPSHNDRFSWWKNFFGCCSTSLTPSQCDPNCDCFSKWRPNRQAKQRITRTQRWALDQRAERYRMCSKDKLVGQVMCTPQSVLDVDRHCNPFFTTYSTVCEPRYLVWYRIFRLKRHRRPNTQNLRGSIVRYRTWYS